MEQSSDYKADEIVEVKKGKMSFTVAGQGYMLGVPIYHNIYNALAAIVCGCELGLTSSEIQGRLERFRSCEGRHKFLRFGKHIIIDDSYNANPVSFRSAVQSLSHGGNQKQKIIVSGDMLELGQESERLHQSLGEEIVRYKVDAVLAFGPMMKYLVGAIKNKTGDIDVAHFDSREDLHQRLKELCQRKESLVLVKGSRGMKMEETINFLREMLKERQ